MPAPTLEPLHQFPVPAAANGSHMVPSADIDAIRGILYVRERIDNPGLLAKAVWHAPDAAAIILPLVLLWVIVAIVRVRRRPHSVGRLHCRRCNYDLAPVTGASPPVCPECGTDTASRPPRIGRTAKRRLLFPVLTGVPLLLGSIAALAFMLEPLGGARGIAWPHPAVLRVFPAAALQKRGADQVPQTIQLSAWDLQAGKRTARPVRLGTRFPLAAAVSPDGRYCIAVASDPGPGGRLLVRIADLDTGMQHGVELPLDPSAQAIVSAFSGDGERAYVQLSHWATPHTADAPYVSSLYRVDLATGNFQCLTQLDTPLVIDGPRPSYSTQRFAVVEVEGEVRWAAFAQLQSSLSASPALCRVRVPGPDGLRSFDVTLPAGSWHTPRLVDGGDTLVIPLFPASLGQARIDLRTGTATVAPHPTGPIAARNEESGLGLVSAPSGPCVRTEDGADVALLSIPAGSTAIPLALSADGRWAAAFVSRPVSRLGVPKLDAAIYVWDLALVRPTRAAPR